MKITIKQLRTIIKEAVEDTHKDQLVSRLRELVEEFIDDKWGVGGAWSVQELGEFAKSKNFPVPTTWEGKDANTSSSLYRDEYDLRSDLNESGVVLLNGQPVGTWSSDTDMENFNIVLTNNDDVLSNALFNK